MGSKWASRLEAVVACGIAAWVLMTTCDALRRAWNFTADDAFITLRYAQHVADGHGIVWNVGEAPLEGYSNFSFLVLGTIAARVGVAPDLVLKGAGAAGFLVALGLMYVLARRSVSPALAVLPAAILTAFKGSIIWAVSGLETGFYLAAALGALAAALAELELVAAGAALLAALTRPEGVVVALCCAAFLATRSRQRALRFAVVFGVPFVAYFAFRLVYFGHVLPNSLRCKLGAAEDPWFLIREFLGAAWPLLGLSLLRPPKDARSALLWAPLGIYLCAAYGMDPVVGGFHRHFMLPLALASVLAVTGVWSWLSRVRIAGVATAAALASALLVAAPRRAAADQAQGWGLFYWFRANTRAALGRYLRALPPSASYVIGDAGLVGYTAPQRSLDAFCLNSAEMTSPAIAKRVPAFVDWTLSQHPDAIAVHTDGNDPKAVAKAYGVFPEIVARPEFRDNYQLAGRFGAPSDAAWYFVYRLKSAEPIAARP
jgi:hypothetical protein